MATGIIGGGAEAGPRYVTPGVLDVNRQDYRVWRSALARYARGSSELGSSWRAGTPVAVLYGFQTGERLNATTSDIPMIDLNILLVALGNLYWFCPTGTASELKY